MIRYLAYIGPKPAKRIQDDSKCWHEFPYGITVDAVALGFSDMRIKFLLKSGVFQLRSSAGEVSPKVAPVPLEQPVEKPKPICPQCGFEAKNLSGLRLHQRWCKSSTS